MFSPVFALFYEPSPSRFAGPSVSRFTGEGLYESLARNAGEGGAQPKAGRVRVTLFETNYFPRTFFARAKASLKWRGWTSCGRMAWACIRK